MSNYKILITGGAGFIGSNLAEHFLTLGHTIVCLDNFSTGHRKNIASLLENDRFTLIEGDIRNFKTCAAAVEGVAYVFHQAALGSVPRSIMHPIVTNDVNISGFLNMLTASRDAGVKRFIFASSSSVYGDSEQLPKMEAITGNPLSPYAITKCVNELYAQVFAKNYGMEYIGLRYFNVFGRRQDPHGEYAAVIPIFIKKLLSHESPRINGDGNFSRDFTYIDNVIQMNLLAMHTSNPAAINTIYNTACGESATLNQLYLFIREFLSVNDPAVLQIDAIKGTRREGDIPHSFACIDKAKEILGYKPVFSLYEGLQEAISWYEKNIF